MRGNGQNNKCKGIDRIDHFLSVNNNHENLAYILERYKKWLVNLLYGTGIT